MKYGHAQTVGTQTSRVRKKLNTLCGLVLIASVASVLSVLTGCAGAVTGSKQQTTTSASFQLSPTTVNFGQVAVGKQATQTVSVSNTGNVGVNITKVTISNSQFSITGMTTPMALVVGQSGSFTVAVNPTATGNLAGTLTAQGDGGSTPVTVNLSATAMNSQAQLSLSQPSINFGSVSVGSKSTSNLLLSNSGTTNLTISLLTLTGAEFTIGGITTPTTIAAGQSAQVAVTFSPTASGSASGSLSITSSDSTNPTLTVPLSGSGSSTPTGQLSANPTSLSFGTMATGTSADKQVVLTNTGTAAVSISSVSAAGTGLTISGVTTPATLNPSETATLTVKFAPTAAGAVSGSIKIVSDAGNSALTIPVTGTGAQAGLTISPASFNFGSVVDGQTKSQTITITNTGTADLTVAQLNVSGTAYSVSGLVTPATVAAGGNVKFSVLFAPTTAATLSGTVSIASNAPNSPNVLSLSGTGTAASVTLSSNPTSLSFTNVNAGSSSSKNVTVTNSGNTSLTVSQITVNAKDFAVSGMTTPTTLAAGQNATMSVAFKPSASENITGNITIMTSQGASDVIPVSGSGVQPGLTITPSSVGFGSVTEGSPSSQTIQLSNSGTGTLTVTQVSVAGTGFSTGTLSLPISLASGNATTFNVQFAPTTAGNASGSVTIVSNAPNSPALVALTGTGVAATQTLTFSTTNLGFGNVNTGNSSTQSVTVTNSGNSSVSISKISESGSGFTLTGAGTPVTLSVGQSLTFGVVFSPSAAGSASGTVTVTSNAAGSPVTIALSGTGVQAATHSVTLNWTASTSSVSGYNVYRSTTNGSGYAKINSSLVGSSTYDDTTVQSGTTYYYVVTSVDSSGNESTDSNQATAVIP
jgi:HYDIN/CFA65/VesB family protein/ASPM-SPD-2-Hydin domain-containing protein/centrosomal CEP192-like protein